MKPKNNRGFTLLEVIIYVGILGMVSVFVINTILITSTSFAKSRVKRNLTVQAGEAMERMLREIRLASSVNTGSSVLGSNPGRLFLNTAVSATNTASITREFFLSGSTLVMREAGSADIHLTSETDITSIIFRRITTAESEAVRVEMAAEDGFNKTKSSANFYGTAILRGAY